MLTDMKQPNIFKDHWFVLSRRTFYIIIRIVMFNDMNTAPNLFFTHEDFCFMHIVAYCCIYCMLAGYLAPIWQQQWVNNIEKSILFSSFLWECDFLLKYQRLKVSLYGALWRCDLLYNQSVRVQWIKLRSFLRHGKPKKTLKASQTQSFKANNRINVDQLATADQTGQQQLSFQLPKPTFASSVTSLYSLFSVWDWKKNYFKFDHFLTVVVNIECAPALSQISLFRF